MDEYSISFNGGKFVFDRNRETFDTYHEAQDYAARVKKRDQALDSYSPSDEGIEYKPDFWTNPLVGVFENSYTVDPGKTYRDVVLTDFWNTHSLMFRHFYFHGDNEAMSRWLGMAERAAVQ